MTQTLIAKLVPFSLESDVDVDNVEREVSALLGRPLGAVDTGVIPYWPEHSSGSQAAMDKLSADLLAFVRSAESTDESELVLDVRVDVARPRRSYYFKCLSILVEALINAEVAIPVSVVADYSLESGINAYGALAALRDDRRLKYYTAPVPGDATENERVLLNDLIRFRGAFRPEDNEADTRVLKFWYSALPEPKRLHRSLQSYARQLLRFGSVVLVLDSDREHWFSKELMAAAGTKTIESSAIDDNAVALKNADHVLIGTSLVRTGTTIQRIRDKVQSVAPATEWSAFALIGALSGDWVTGEPLAQPAFNASVKIGPETIPVDFMVRASQVELGYETWQRQAAESAACVQSTSRRRVGPRSEIAFTQVGIFSLFEDVAFGPEDPVPEDRRDELGFPVPQLHSLPLWDAGLLAQWLVDRVEARLNKSSSGLLFVMPGEAASSKICDALRRQHSVTVLQLSREVIEHEASLPPSDGLVVAAFPRGSVVICDESTVTHTTLKKVYNLLNDAGRPASLAAVVADFSASASSAPEWVDALVNWSGDELSQS